ncbi:MAG: hypothetical protein ABEI27_03805 [Halobellus sp.]|uniref:hypothetical protein n=1 Tax=Halobellus sp. TaxID=1979212 RepID=UPI0035D42DA4
MSDGEGPVPPGSQSADNATQASPSEVSVSSQALPYVAALLTVVVAGQHLLHPEEGLLELFAILYTNPAFLLSDPRPLAFTLSGTALLVGLSLSRNAPDRRPYYVGGIAIAATFLVGYFVWHFTGHGGFLPGREPLLHGLSPLENVLAHLRSSVWAVTTKASEIALIAVLAVLYYRE